MNRKLQFVAGLLAVGIALPAAGVNADRVAESVVSGLAVRGALVVGLVATPALVAGVLVVGTVGIAKAIIDKNRNFPRRAYHGMGSEQQLAAISAEASPFPTTWHPAARR